MTPKICCFLIFNLSLSFSITKQIRTALIQRHKSHMSWVISYLIKTEHTQKKCTVENLVPWPSRFDLKHHYGPGFAFHANSFPEPGSSLLMALPIKLEAYPNTNIPQYFEFVTSVPPVLKHSNYNNVLFSTWN